LQAGVEKAPHWGRSYIYVLRWSPCRGGRPRWGHGGHPHRSRPGGAGRVRRRGGEVRQGRGGSVAGAGGSRQFVE